MKLTVKDKEFLEKLKKLLSEKELKIDLKEDGVKRLVLCQNYGDKVQRCFNMTRQGVRGRSRHLTEIYVGAYAPKSATRQMTSLYRAGCFVAMSLST